MDFQWGFQDFMGKPWENDDLYIVIDGLVGGLEPWNFIDFPYIGKNNLN